MKKKAGIFKTILVVALITLMLVVGFVSAKYVQNNTIGSFDLAIEKAYTYNLIDGPSFNSIFYNKASNAESVTFCSKAELDQSIFNDLTLTHVGATENDGIFLGVSTDGKTAYVIADSKDPNQKIIANSDCSMMFSNMIVDLGGRPLKAIDLSGLDTSNTTNMSSMFSGCTGLIDLDLSGLDTTNVTDMSSMFDSCNSLPDLDLSGFDTTNVTDMSGMFNSCNSLTDLDLSGFNTANVTNMEVMFQSCGSLTTIYASDKFTVDKATNSTAMFFGCSNLVGGKGTAYDASHIDKSYAHIDGGMNNPGYFTDKNAPATTYNLIDGPSFNSIFSNMGPFISLTFCSKAQLDQSIFNGLTLTHIGATENDAVYLGVPPKTRAPEVSSIKAYVIADSDDPNQKIIANSDCSRMFYGWYRCALDLSNFDTSKVTDMSNMFCNCQYVTSLDLSGFDTSNVTNMNRMFRGMTHVQTIYASENFVTDQVTDSFEMFSNCYNLVGEKGTAYDKLHIDKSYAHIDGGVSNPGYFTDKKAPVVANYILASGETVNNTLKTFAPNATTILFGNNQDLENWKTDNPEVSLTYTTIGASSISEVLLYNGGSTALIIANTDDPAQKVVANQNCSNMFAFLNQIESIDLSGLDTSNTARMDGMFYKCENLTNLNLSNIDTTKVTNMYAMFYECKTLKSVDLSSFNTNKVTNMSGMFGWCDNLEHANVSNFNTENVTDMNLMFVGCRKLAEIDVSGFKTGKVTNMYEMFYGCETVKKLDVTSFDTALVENMSGMFYECKTLESIDLSSFNTSRVTNMAAMFGWCEKLTQLDISSFSTENVTDMHYMFTNSAIQTIYTSENFITDQVTNSDSMFNACVNLVGGKGTVYDNSNIDKSYAHIDGGTNNPGYFTDKNAQDNPTIIDTPVLLTWMNTLMTWGERKELKAVINNIDNTDGLQTVLTIENEAGDQIQEPVTLTAKNNEWTVLIDTFAFTEGVYKVTVSEITDPSGEREFTGGFVSSSCVIRISPCQISFSDASTAIGAGTSATITGAISGLPNGDLPDCFNLIKVNLVDSYGEITQVPMQIIREDDQAIYRFDIPNNLKAGVYKVYVNLTEVSGYVIGPNDSLEPNIGTIIVSFNTNSESSGLTENGETNNAQDSEVEPAA